MRRRRGEQADAADSSERTARTRGLDARGESPRLRRGPWFPVLRRWARRVLIGLLLAWAGERVGDLVDPYPIHLLDRFDESRQVYAADGTLLRMVPTEEGERRIHLPLAAFSPHVKAAVTAAEDRRFGEHSGVDPLAVVRAGYRSVVRGRIVSGASTLHMQLARIVEPHGRNLTGKLLEMRRARQLARRLSDDAVLEAYLNLAPFANNIRGFPAASLHWFGKSAVDLAPEEAATLAAMLPAPSRRRPGVHSDELLGSRNRILDAMRARGAIDAADWRRARKTKLTAKRHAWPWRAPHLCDLILKTDERIRVETDVDPELQAYFQKLVRDQRPAGVDGVAMVVLDRSSGGLVSLVGSRSWRKSQLNAATSRRSAGSTLKPFIYALAVELGVTGPDALVPDTPLNIAGYDPENFDRTWSGAVRTAEALRTSRNAPAVRMLRAVGASRFRELLRSLGIDPGPHVLHLDAALGTIAVSPLQLARAYLAFASPDAVIPGTSPDVRQRVLDLLKATSPDPSQVPDGAVAWKTGTSSGRRDAWCAGVTDRHVIVVWLGNLHGNAAPDLVGSRAAAGLLASAVATLR